MMSMTMVGKIDLFEKDITYTSSKPLAYREKMNSANTEKSNVA